MKTDDQELTVPTLHLNGSGWNNLYRDYSGALEALKAAMEALPVPHGRDYYVQDDGAYERARAQFEAQVAKIREVEEEVRAILEKIYEQHRE